MAELIEAASLSPEVVHIFLNRPEKKNALSLEMMGKLLDVLKAIPKSTRVVILEGKGAFFCAGMDLEDVIRHGKECMNKMEAVFTAISNLHAITIVKIRGGAFAGGLGLVAAADLAFASSDSLFSLPELQRGLVPAFVQMMLKDQCSPRFLNEFILTGERITAAKAEKWGMINEAVSSEELDRMCLEKIQLILKSAPYAAKAFKKHCICQNNLQEKFKIAYGLHECVFASGESREGIQAFLEKRAPQWAEKNIGKMSD